MEQKPAKNRNRGKNKRIGFTEEVLTRDVAENLLSKEQNSIKSDANTFRSKLVDEELISSGTNIAKIKSKKRKQKESKDEETEITVTKLESRKKKKKNKADSAIIQNGNQITNSLENGDANDSDEIKSDKSLSKRALKRERHQQFLEVKKRKSDINSQNKALNYLSNWKYNKSEWKFEKMKQVWLVQHLYDPAKIDDQHWETLIEYFNGSQGKVRDKILEEAIKIVEDEEIELNNKIKFKRAKDIVQFLQ